MRTHPGFPAHLGFAIILKGSKVLLDQSPVWLPHALPDVANWNPENKNAGCLPLD